MLLLNVIFYNISNYSSQISDEGIKYLSDKISMNLNNINSLALKFGGGQQ